MNRALFCLVLLASGLVAAEPPAPAEKAPSPDPTAAVVADGRFIYRQRDLDALVLIAQRYAKQKLSRTEEEQVRQVLIGALPGREALIDACAGLPASLAGKARDQFLLDLLDYQAEKAPPKALTPGEPQPAAPAAAPAQPPAAGPVLVRLPDLVLNRQLEGLGRRQLTIGLALNFADGAQNRLFEAKAAILQDAVLGYLHGLSAAEFADPNQVALKAGLTKAIQAKLPEFPSDAVLIPQLDVSTPDAK
jgi:flagellar basal body-associated protein FliL